MLKIELLEGYYRNVTYI